MKALHHLSILCLLAAMLLAAPEAIACTSAIVRADATLYGRPLLWKHRDTSAGDNVVEYIPASAGTHAYVALFNATDRARKEAWMGMNDAGFAVMNTASYNIKDDKVPPSKMDREGIVMTMALKRCRTVADFQALLDELIATGRPLGVEANFGVIDADGEGAFFETNNHAYKVFLLSDAPDGILIRTNYSHSGRAGGYGHVRERNAAHQLLEPARNHLITAEMLTEDVSRCFYRDSDHKDFTLSTPRQVADVDFIPRFKSTATIVIEGIEPGSAPKNLTDEYVMWTALGYPPTAETDAVFCHPDGVPEQLQATTPKGHSTAGDESLHHRDKAFAPSRGKSKTVNLDYLFNAEGTGYTQELVKRNREMYARELKALGRKPQ